jgi:anthranilate 1,2-dioxygenase small subunit
VIATASAREVLEDLHLRYVDALDDDHLEAWPELFTDGCSYRVMSAENEAQGLPLAVIRADSRGMLRDRVAALRSTAMYIPRTMRRLVTNVHVLSADERAIAAKARFAVFQTLPDEPTTVFAVGTYHDVAVLDDDGAWRFREKRCVYDGIIPNSLVIPL